MSHCNLPPMPIALNVANMFSQSSVKCVSQVHNYACCIGPLVRHTFQYSLEPEEIECCELTRYKSVVIQMDQVWVVFEKPYCYEFARIL